MSSTGMRVPRITGLPSITAGLISIRPVTICCTSRKLLGYCPLLPLEARILRYQIETLHAPFCRVEPCPIFDAQWHAWQQVYTTLLRNVRRIAGLLCTTNAIASVKGCRPLAITTYTFASHRSWGFLASGRSPRLPSSWHLSITKQPHSLTRLISHSISSKVANRRKMVRRRLLRCTGSRRSDQAYAGFMAILALRGDS